MKQTYSGKEIIFYLIVINLQAWGGYSVFSPNTGRYGPEKTSYLDTIHTVNSSLKGLNRTNQFARYNDIIRNQEEAGIVEKVDKTPNCENKELYISHKADAREATQVTKVRIVYSALGKKSSKDVLLNRR